MKKLFILSVLGLVGGHLLATWVGPSLLSWWFEPPVQLGFNCTEPIRWAMQRLITLQLVGSVIGLVFGFLLSLLFFARKKKVPENAVYTSKSGMA